MANFYKSQTVLFFLCFLFQTYLQAQCNASGFSVSRTNGSCFQNGVITVSIPGASTCSGWNAILTRPDSSETTLAIPANGGPINFSSLAAGNYRVRLFNGITTYQWGANPISITTSYVNMNINSSATVPSCQVTSSNFTNNATLTVNVPSGGIGPFFYSVTSSLGTQTFGATSTRTHTFTGLPGGETLAFTVVDSANNQVGCTSSQTQTRAILNNTLSIFFEGPMDISRRCRQTNYAGCNDSITVTMRVRQTGAPIVTHYGQYRINGGAWTSPSSGTTDNYHIIFAKVGDSYEFRAFNNCDTIFRSGIFPNAPAKQVLASVTNVPNSCGYTYDINTDDQTTICLPATYFLQYFNGSSWDSVSIFTTSVRNNIFNVTLPGNYRVIVFDGCDTIKRTITVSPASSPINSISIIEGTSTLAGTSSIYFNQLPGGISIPLTVTITPLYPYTNPVSINATAPKALAGTYNITFPYTRVFNNSGISYDNHVLSDLPLGQYQVVIADLCGNSTTRIINLTTPTTYNPNYFVNIGCANSNTLVYDLNSNHRFIFTTTGALGRFELIALTTGILQSTASSDSMIFTNLPSGYYRIRASRTLPDAQHSAYPDNKFSIATGLLSIQSFDMDTVFVPPYQNIGTTVQTITCNSSVGSIRAAINSGTPVYPLIYKLFDATGTILIDSDTAYSSSAANAQINIFSNLSFGNYVLNIVSGYSALTPNGCYTLNQNVSLNNTAVTPNIQLSDSIVCISHNATQLGILLDLALWNVRWMDISGNTLGTNVNTINQSPIANTQYIVQFQLKNNLGCIAPPLLADTTLIVVVNEPDTLGKIIVGDTICQGSNGVLMLSNANNGVFYEVFQNGHALNPRITNTATANGSLTFNIPNSQLSMGTNVFQIKASNGVCNGGLLNATASIIQVPSISITAIATSACLGSNTGALNTSVSGGIGNYTYHWSHGATIAAPIGLLPGAYALTVSDENSCSSTASFTVDTLTPSTPTSIIGIPGTVCPNTNITLTASGGTSGSGAVINWYSGPNGTGTLLGSGNSIVIAPTGNTTVYARRIGTCNTTADASTTVATKYYIYASNGMSTNTYCTDNAGWHHFYIGDEIIYSVQGNISSAPAGFPIATIYDHGAYYQSHTGPNNAASCVNGWLPGEERFEMKRSWNLNMGGGATTGAYQVRFYYQPAERTAIENAATAWMAAYPACAYSYKYATPLGFYWFKNTGTAYSAPLFDGTHYGATIGSTFNAINYAQWSAVPGFSGGSGAIILVPTALLLPVEWQYFTGATQAGINKLEWATASEENTDKFEVQRSKDAIHFETIAELSAAGNSSESSYYHFDDLTPFVGPNYYRLRLVNKDLSAELSDVLVLDIAENEEGYSFYPNPTKDELYYQVKAEHIEDIQMEVLDVLGRTLHTKTLKLAAGLNKLSMEMGTFAAGTYLARVTHLSSGIVRSAKIVKN